MTNKDYIKAAIENMEKNLSENYNIKLTSKAPTPLLQSCIPEHDMF